MGLDEVAEDILKKGQEKVEEIKKEGKDEATKILKDALKKEKDILTNAETDAKKRVERLVMHERSRAELDIKRRILVMEKEMLDEVMAKAKDKVVNLPSEKNQALLRKLLQKHESEGRVIYTNAQSEAFVKSNTRLRFGGTIDCLGGVIIESEDGTVRHDYTYDNLLESASEASMNDVAKILFD